MKLSALSPETVLVVAALDLLLALRVSQFTQPFVVCDVDAQLLVIFVDPGRLFGRLSRRRY